LQENIDSLGSNFEEQNFLRQVKYSVDSLAWLNGAIARIINNLYKEHVTALRLVFNNTRSFHNTFIVKVNFASKLKWKYHKEQIKDLISNFLFASNNNKFIINATKKQFYMFLKKYATFLKMS
jgi:hypothetical protein